ncbi:MAG: hypothetical protein SF052_11730 [Bacteroidia bacterium]|nr:hypothetical protein [Bacteroidia bacterium]
MNKLRDILTAVYFSFPIQILARQIQRRKTLITFWLVPLGFITGAIGKSVGGAHLFLDPEYLGKENFWSVFIVGSALGAFLFAYMITLYINESYNFHFIARSRSPFYTFAYNNFIIPGILLFAYFACFIEYHAGVAGGFTWSVVEKTVGLFMGMGLIFLISATYFFANRSLIQRYGKKIEEGITGKNNRHNRWVIIGKAREGIRNPQRTDNYLVFPFRIKTVEQTSGPELHNVVSFLHQHHGKLLLMQILTFLLIAGLGLVEGNRYFQIPAGASFLLFFSLMMMIIGAITFWVRKSGFLTMLILLGTFFIYDQVDFLSEKNQAFGLNYEVMPADYSRENLEKITSQEIYDADRAATLAMLEQWKAHYQKKYGTYSKPKAIFVTASGGGLRSAFWTFRSMQYLDSLTSGRFYDEIRLMTGASGGMFGLTYYRELAFNRSQGEVISLKDRKYQENIAKDLLNRIFFKMYADVFLPNRKIKIDDRWYDRETGYSFDQQLSINLPELKNRRLGAYSEMEAAGIIPPVILTPTILNQGKKLYISASPVSFLTRTNHITDRHVSKAGGVEFRRLFADQGADSLFMTTALRMNATFPYVLPIVELPSHPAMEVMDAGAIDNYGTQTSLRYLFEFKDWFAANTEGVIFVQIRDNEREDPIKDKSSTGITGKLMAPVGGGYYSMSESKDMSNDYLMEFVREWYDGYVEVVPIQYFRETNTNPASLSLHLTQREKENIRKGIFTQQNQEAFRMLSALFENDLLADKK